MIGILESYYEIGMDHVELVLNVSNKIVLLRPGQNLKVYCQNGDILYKGPLLKITDPGYSHGFTPMGVSFDEFYSWFTDGLRAELYMEDNYGKEEEIGG